MNIIIIIIVPYYTINITVFKLILQPGNSGLRNRYLYTPIYPVDHCSLFENIMCSISKTRRKDIQFKNKTQKLYKCIYYVRSSSSLARQSMVDPGLLEEFCPFASVKGSSLPILDS